MAQYPCPDCPTISNTVSAWCDHRWEAHQVDASMPWDTVPREVAAAERARADAAEQQRDRLAGLLAEAYWTCEDDDLVQRITAALGGIPKPSALGEEEP